VVERSAPAPGDRGFALLIVLWWTVLLVLLGSQLAASGRLDAQRAGNLRAAAMAEAAADGVLQEAVFHLLDGSPAGWAADGSVHPVLVAGGVARVEIRSEAAKIGLNQASPALLAALLTRLGTDRRQSAALADAILDWRTATARPRRLGAKAPEYRAAGLDYAPPNSDFESIDELGLVRGMTPELVARLAPYVSVYQTGDPDLALADAVVRLASADAHDVAADPAERVGLPNDVAPVVIVRVAVEMKAGAQVVHHAVIRLAVDAARHPFQLLDQN
jgi:general secretion pathway protein K